MTDFKAITFPDTISWGATGGPKFQTTVQMSKAGKEKRNIDWAYRRGEWDVAHGIKSDTEYAELLDFFHVVRGRAYEFRFHDWGDDTAEEQNLGKGDGATAAFQCQKTYTFGSETYTRYITKVNPSSEDTLKTTGTNPWIVKVGATWATAATQVEGAGNDYTVDRDTGIITFNAGSIPGSSDYVFATFEFFCHVRFDVDHLLASKEMYNNNVWGNIKIVEIKPNV